MPSRLRTQLDNAGQRPDVPRGADTALPVLHERLYRSLYRIRRVEEEIVRIYPTDKIKSPVHLSIGQEAVAVGVCETLRREDVVFGSYRGHAMYLAKGGDLKRMIAELYGKVTGIAKGKGGSMHLVDVANGVMGASAVVGSTISNAVGYAYANKYLRRGSIVVSFFGDGATEEGAFYESVNFAALKGLPIIFVCENNGYAIHTRQSARQPLANICERAAVFGIPTERIENNDVLRIYERVGAAVDALRSGKPGPFFFECMTYRWKEHVGPGEDFGFEYRPREELDRWKENDQVARIGALVPAEARASVERQIEEEIRAAFAFAEESPFPEANELRTDVFREP
ncbi:MAG: thiamine pyrophosphate-dependent dehydrogenase E1 component subunit alpha [Methyloceanibacter sp.]